MNRKDIKKSLVKNHNRVREALGVRDSISTTYKDLYIQAFELPSGKVANEWSYYVVFVYEEKAGIFLRSTVLEHNDDRQNLVKHLLEEWDEFIMSAYTKVIGVVLNNNVAITDDTLAEIVVSEYNLASLTS